MSGHICQVSCTDNVVEVTQDAALGTKMLRLAARAGLRRTLASIPRSRPPCGSLTRRVLASHPYIGRIQTLSRSFAAVPPPLEKSKAITEARGSDLVLSPPALVVTREFEWGNIILGFEQANKYTIRAAPGGDVVGYIAEEDSLGKSITRNIMRRNRSFRATVLDKHGDPVFIIRRPFYVFSTSMFVETPHGEVIGEVHMNWHLYRRKYSMYIEKNQFASVDSGFLAFDFEMRDEDGKKIASVNKDFTGFAREIFTDAGQYVLRMDPSMGLDAGDLVKDASSVVPAAEASTVGAKLTQDQRAVLLSTAIAIDFDYFSQHSRGMGPGMMMMPMPIPGGGGGGAGGAGAMAGADAASAAMMGEDDDGLGEEGDGLGDEAMDSGDQSGAGFNDSGFQGPGSDFQSPDNANQEWATFEEADHGFADEPSNDGSDDWGFSDGGGGGDGDGEGGGIGSILGGLRDIFGDMD